MTIVLLVVVGVVVLVALAVLVAVLLRRSSRRREQERLDAAAGLRTEAVGHVPDVRAATERAQAADAQAQEARARADQAERTAAGAHRALAQEQAAQEDVVRRADELDPRVDTDADDYRPITGPDMKGATPEQQPGRHQRPV